MTEKTHVKRPITKLSSWELISAYGSAILALILWSSLSIDPDRISNSGYSAQYTGAILGVTGIALGEGIWLLIRGHIVTGLSVILLSLAVPLLGGATIIFSQLEKASVQTLQKEPTKDQLQQNNNGEGTP